MDNHHNHPSVATPTRTPAKQQQPGMDQQRTPIASISRNRARNIRNSQYSYNSSYNVNSNMSTCYSPMHPPRLASLDSNCNEDEHKDAIAMFSPKQLSAANLAPPPSIANSGAVMQTKIPYLPDAEMEDVDVVPTFHSASVPSDRRNQGYDYEEQQPQHDISQYKNIPQNYHTHLYPSSHSNQQEESQISVEEEEEEEEEFDPYLFMKYLPPKDLMSIRNLNIPGLPPKLSPSPKYTLVLDLDETLVHCTVDNKLCPSPDLTFDVEFHEQVYRVYVKKRPYLMDFLNRIRHNFEVVVFTASQSVYANKLLDLLDPQRKLIQHRIFRESCVLVQGNYLKDLTLVLGPSRPIEKSILVDNSPHAFGYNIDNGIPIESWFDDLDDKELLKLEMFLEEHIIRNNCNDVRSVIRDAFDTRSKVESAVA